MDINRSTVIAVTASSFPLAGLLRLPLSWLISGAWH